jgi:hypothetical protein
MTKCNQTQFYETSYRLPSTVLETYAPTIKNRVKIGMGSVEVRRFEIRQYYHLENKINLRGPRGGGGGRSRPKIADENLQHR